MNVIWDVEFSRSGILPRSATAGTKSRPLVAAIPLEVDSRPLSTKLRRAGEMLQRSFALGSQKSCFPRVGGWATEGKQQRCEMTWGRLPEDRLLLDPERRHRLVGEPVTGKVPKFLEIGERDILRLAVGVREEKCLGRQVIAGQGDVVKS